MNNEVIKQDKWIKRSALRFFDRLDDSMKVPTIVAINFDKVFKVMQAEWEWLSRDAYYITVVARHELADRVSSKIYQEDDILRAETAVFQAFESTFEFFNTRIKQAEQLLMESGIQTDAPASSNSKRFYEAISSTRTSSRWLEVLRKFDRYFWLNHQLWVANLIGPESWTDQEALGAKLRNETRARQAVTQLTHAVNKEFSQIRTIVNRVSANREEVEAARRREQSERDRQNAEKAEAEAAAKAATSLTAASKKSKKKAKPAKAPALASVATVEKPVEMKAA